MYETTRVCKILLSHPYYSSNDKSLELEIEIFIKKPDTVFGSTDNVWSRHPYSKTENGNTFLRDINIIRGIYDSYTNAMQVYTGLEFVI